LKLFQEWGEGIKKSGEGVKPSKIYLIHCKNKCHNVPQLSKTIKNLKEKKKKNRKACRHKEFFSGPSLW
jgi:hypothetical protein